MNKEQASHNTPPAEEDRGEPLEWALDEIDVLSNMLVQFAYPQGAAMVGREEQAQRYVAARQAARLLSSPRVEGETRLREALERWDRLSLVVESAVRNRDMPNYLAVVAAITMTRAALSPQGE